jgi:hypothetical protein
MDIQHEELHAFLCASQAQLAKCLPERKMLRTKMQGKTEHVFFTQCIFIIDSSENYLNMNELAAIVPLCLHFVTSLG